jgi:hypothetical protein
MVVGADSKRLSNPGPAVSDGTASALAEALHDRYAAVVEGRVTTGFLPTQW